MHSQPASTGADPSGDSKSSDDDGIRIDQRTKRASWKSTTLTINQQTDFDVLVRLTDDLGAVVSHVDLYRAARPSALVDDTSTLKEADPAVKDAVHHINKALKVAHCPWEIRAVRRKGYQLSYNEEST